MAEPQPKPDSGIIDPELNKALAQLSATIAANPKKHEPESAATASAPPPPTKVYQLPIWPEPVRGTPNSFLRSALFAAIHGKNRRWLKRELLASMQGVTVRFTGQQLDQSDLDVLEEAYHLARQHPLGNVCHFTAYAFLKSLGRSTGKSDYEWLDGAIERLKACAVMIETRQKIYGKGLVAGWMKEKASSTYKLTLDADMMLLYGWNDWTAIDREQRAALRGKPLALWLHGFYSSHAKPFPIKIETLHKLTGSGNKEMRDFKRKLKAAFADLEAATGIKGTIGGDLVTVERSPTRSQQRHLTCKAGQREAIHGRRRRKGINWRKIGQLV